MARLWAVYAPADNAARRVLVLTPIKEGLSQPPTDAVDGKERNAKECDGRRSIPRAPPPSR